MRPGDSGREGPGGRRPVVGVSACLLGRNVRFDGGHSRDRFVTDVLGALVDLVPVCPEMAAGFGAPRDTFRLERRGGEVRAIVPKTGEDVTGTLRRTAEELVELLSDRELSGYVLKRASPTCGMERVKVYDGNSVPTREGVGLFAAALMARFPNLPVEEEGRLHDGRLRENFVMRVLVHDRWRRLRREEPTRGALVRFHAAHKILVLAHDQRRYRELGPLVARAAERPIEAVLDRYETTLLQALSRPASRKGHVNALQHLAGFLRGHVDPDARADIRRVIDEYRKGWVPLVTATTLLDHHLRRLGHGWLDRQVYLAPYPRELGLRSAV